MPWYGPRRPSLTRLQIPRSRQRISFSKTSPPAGKSAGCAPEAPVDGALEYRLNPVRSARKEISLPDSKATARLPWCFELSNIPRPVVQLETRHRFRRNGFNRFPSMEGQSPAVGKPRRSAAVDRYGHDAEQILKKSRGRPFRDPQIFI